MASFDDIRRGLAANLHALDGFQVSAYLRDSPTPPTVQVAGVDEIEYDRTHQRGSDRLSFVIEACLGRAVDIQAQKALDALLDADGPTSLKEILEADQKLTSRLLDDGNVVRDQPSAAGSVCVTAYKGQAKFTLPNGTEVLLATWSVEVVT